MLIFDPNRPKLNQIEIFSKPTVQTEPNRFSLDHRFGSVQFIPDQKILVWFEKLSKPTQTEPFSPLDKSVLLLVINTYVAHHISQTRKYLNMQTIHLGNSGTSKVYVHELASHTSHGFDKSVLLLVINTSVTHHIPRIRKHLNIQTMHLENSEDIKSLCA